MENKPVKIVCTECNSIQDAVIEDAWPFPIYVHTCTSCGYIIMESEWNEVKQSTNGKEENNTTGIGILQ